MTIDGSGLIAIQARIAAIQSRFVPAPASSQSFAAVLVTLTGGPEAAPTGAQVVADARRYLGVPYALGSTDPAKGLDCSALVQRVYRDLGVDLPRVSQDPSAKDSSTSRKRRDHHCSPMAPRALRATSPPSTARGLGAGGKPRDQLEPRPRPAGLNPPPMRPGGLTAPPTRPRG